MALSLSKIFSFGHKATRVTNVVGIDIGSSSVKVVELEDTGRTIMLKTYGELQLGPYDEQPLGETVLLNAEKRTEAVVDVIREAGVGAKNGVFAIPLSSSFLTIIPIAAGNEDLGARIRVEARKYIPVPLNDVTLDWSELPQYGSAKTKVQEILLAAIENDALKEYKQLLNAIGMVSQPSEIEAFSTMRALTKEDDSSLAIVDLGAKTAKLYIVQDNGLQRIHRVSTGGAKVTTTLSQNLGISFQEAENSKRSYTKGGTYAREIEQATTTVFEGAIQEFKRIINQYEVRTESPINRIVLTGGASSFPPMTAYVADMFAHEVTRADPFSRVAYPAFMEDTLTDIGTTFGVSLGAALRLFE